MCVFSTLVKKKGVRHKIKYIQGSSTRSEIRKLRMTEGGPCVLSGVEASGSAGPLSSSWTLAKRHEFTASADLARPFRGGPGFKRKKRKTSTSKNRDCHVPRIRLRTCVWDGCNVTYVSRHSRLGVLYSSEISLG